jgi:hypothetical protein
MGRGQESRHLAVFQHQQERRFAHPRVAENEETTIAVFGQVQAPDKPVKEVECRLPRNVQAGAIYFVGRIEVLEVGDHIATG